LRYQPVSLESAALVKWFTTLRQKEWLGALTPPVEDHMQKRIGRHNRLNNRKLNCLRPRVRESNGS